MKSLLLAVLLISTSRPATTTVYVCDSSRAHRYHLTKNCRGLNNCKHRIIEMSIEKAKAENRTLCGWEK